MTKNQHHTNPLNATLEPISFSENSSTESLKPPAKSEPCASRSSRKRSHSIISSQLIHQDHNRNRTSMLKKKPTELQHISKKTGSNAVVIFPMLSKGIDNFIYTLSTYLQKRSLKFPVEALKCCAPSFRSSIAIVGAIDTLGMAVTAPGLFKIAVSIRSSN